MVITDAKMHPVVRNDTKLGVARRRYPVSGNWPHDPLSDDVKSARKIRCITPVEARILIYMTYEPSSFNRESWQQPRPAIMRAFGDSLSREASG
jgi:hypothetical protein